MGQKYENQRNIRRKQRPIAIAGVGLLIFLLGMILLIMTKTVNLNQYVISGYPIRGVDVSHYQGEIDWSRLSEQNIQFAFIKATEGSSYLDERFATNWKDVAETELYSGAYHFFSFDSSGQTQAEWYIETVGSLDGRLVPVVDVEYYGDKELNPPPKEQVVRQLQEFLTTLEAYYQVKPMIYTTHPVYRRYLKGEFEEYLLWIRNVYYPADVDLKGVWKFWQYTDRAVLDGYHGEERYIDLNVFYGTEEEWKDYVVDESAPQ